MNRSFLIVLIVAVTAAVMQPDRGLSAQPSGGADAQPAAQSMTAVAEPAVPRSGVYLEALDRATRPQDDFYQFVNGGWLDTTEIPDIYAGYTVYHQVYEETEAALRQIVERAAADPGEAGTESQQVGDIYASWMDVDTINRKGLDPIRGNLAKVAAIQSRADLVRTMAELYRQGVEVPYEFEIDPDRKDSSRYTVYFRQAGITMPNRDYYLDADNENFAKAREELPRYASRLLSRAGMPPLIAEKAGAKVYALEAAIAEAQWDAVRNRDPELTHNPYPVAQLDELGGHLDWAVTREVLGLAGETQLVLYQPSYFEALDKLVADQPLNSWKHYLAFRLLDSTAYQLDEGTAAIRFDYRNRVLNGQEVERPRWKLGIAMVNGTVGEALGKLYVAGHFPPQAKAKMEELVGNVITTLDLSLEDLEWMSEATREKAREKLSKFTAKIGYPDKWKDYASLEIVPGDHFGNARRAWAWEYQRNLDKLGQPVDRDEWFMTPQTVNAYYNPVQNEIVFPAARLQPPFFQLDADDAINYGAVGGVIGHEISHGFDDKGSKFDGDGNLADWWTEADRAAFEQRTRALIEQFNAFEPVEGMRINGALTLGENIGDLSGVAMAYRAYVRSLDGSEAPVIDGFTGAQRFFIGYAMSRKGKYRDEAIVARLASDPHSPLKYRVIGPYRNIDPFHDAFGTQPDDGMWLAPADRVRIW
jgi:predicted metalloendopeptidase